MFFASCAPPVIHPNVYGIDMPARHEYIAYNRSIDEIRSEIGADWLIYQNLEDLVSACTLGGNQKMTFDCSCFNGEYVAGNIDSAYLEKLESKRKDGSKYRQQAMT